MHTKEQKLLLEIARDSIARSFDEGNGNPLGEAEKDEGLQEIGPGAFVTLKEKGNLRGCIGYLVGDRPICRLVDMLAKEAAFEDYRFRPLVKEELPLCDIEISILSVPKAIRKKEEFLPGRDGIILTVAGRRAVFLPQVATEQGWGREEMLRNLSLKAGLPPDAYLSPSAEFETFTAEVFGEKDGQV